MAAAGRAAEVRSEALHECGRRQDGGAAQDTLARASRHIGAGAAGGIRKTQGYERQGAGCRLKVSAGALAAGQQGTVLRYCTLRTDAAHVRARVGVQSSMHRAAVAEQIICAAAPACALTAMPPH